MDNERMDGLTLDIEAADRDKLRAVFPQCFEECKLNIDRLLNLCGEYITVDFEKYEFRWKGKGEAFQLAAKRSTATLRPCREDSLDWDTTRNVYIEGDNLEVLKLLQTSYYRKVKMIYIDPPYNTGNDFIYPDDFRDPLARYKEVTQQTTKSNPESMGRFHTKWLNMMYPRLRLAANLLRDDGVIFISIDDTEVTNLRRLCDEIFGEENFAAQIPWRKRTAKSDVPFGISQDYEWIIVYAKTVDFSACLKGGTRKYFETEDLPGRPWRIHDLTKQTSASERPNSFFTIVDPKTGNEYPANPNRTWAITEETFKQYYAENRIVFPGDYDFLTITKPAFRYFKEDDMAKAGDKFGFIPVSTKLPEDIGMTQDGTKDIDILFERKVFGFPKPVALIKYLIKMATSTSKDESDIILDFFSGSATAAHAVMQLNAEDGGNRRFIMVQLPELCDDSSEAYKAGYKNICEIGKARIRKAGERIKAEDEKWERIPLNRIDGSQIGDESAVPIIEVINTQDGKPPIELVDIKKNTDVGFRVFKLDSSNLSVWDSSPIMDDEHGEEILLQRLLDHLDILKRDRTDEDVVFEVMLKLGQDLCEVVTPLDVNGKTVYGVGADVTFIVCLAEGITVKDAEAMAEYAPGRIVFADRCFTSTEQKANVRLTLRDKGVTIKTL